MRVLIVDDNEDSRQVLREYLPSSATEIFECADGADALTLFSELRPDWVLMDQEMPSVDGLTATARILNFFPNANICMVTAFDHEELMIEALGAGARGFVAKEHLYRLSDVLINLSSK